MELKEVEIFSEAPNYSIVRMPGRHFPGCVLQGDSLAILAKTALHFQKFAHASGDETLIANADDLAQKLTGRLAHYESVLKAHGIPLPY